MIAPMGRPRQRGKRDLPTGLYRDKAGTFYVKHPVTGKQATLGTKDPATARRLFDLIREEWQTDVESNRERKIKARLTHSTDDKLVADYAADWRERRIPHLTKKNGKPLGKATKKAYEGMMRRDVEHWAAFNDAYMGEVDAVMLRKFLRQWIESPSMYNYVLAALTRLFRDAVDEGLIPKNPTKDIERRGVPKRELYVTDDQYMEIIRNVEAGAGHESDTEHEWIARAVDLIYLISHNPQDILAIRDRDITVYSEPVEDTQSGELLYGEIPIARGKTGQAVIIYANEDLIDVVLWFQNWKRTQRLVSKQLICYPLSMPKRWRHLVGQPVPVAHISRRFTAAARAAGLDGYTLRDMRPKALTDEWLAAGDSDKGGHMTQAMKDHYRRIKLPMRARSNLRRLKG